MFDDLLITLAICIGAAFLPMAIYLVIKGLLWIVHWLDKAMRGE